MEGIYILPGVDHMHGALGQATATKRRAGTWWGPCGTPCLPRSGFLCAKQPSVRLTSAALLEICPQLSSPPGESQFLTEVSGPSVAGPCRPTVQVPVQLGR